MTISKLQALDEWDLPFGGTDEVEIVSDKQTGSGRWSKHYELVIKYNGKFWMTTYSVGTGDEGERPWEYDDEVTFEEVTPVEVTTYKYVKVQL